jgi:hypothetical protein
VTRFVNLTPHVVRVYIGTSRHPMDDAGNPYAWLVYPMSGSVAGVDLAADHRRFMHGAPLTRWVIGEIVGLPAQQAGIVYIVSSMVGREAAREDCISPDTKHYPIFDADERLYAVRRFQQWGRRQ